MGEALIAGNLASTGGGVLGLVEESLLAALLFGLLGRRASDSWHLLVACTSLGVCYMLALAAARQDRPTRRPLIHALGPAAATGGCWQPCEADQPDGGGGEPTAVPALPGGHGRGHECSYDAG